jgi:hypothetical protein
LRATRDEASGGYMDVPFRAPYNEKIQSFGRSD